MFIRTEQLKSQINTSYSPSTVQHTLLHRFFLLLQYVSFLSTPPVELLTACINCINAYAKTQPGLVWPLMRTAGILGDTSHGTVTTQQPGRYFFSPFSIFLLCFLSVYFQ